MYSKLKYIRVVCRKIFAFETNLLSKIYNTYFRLRFGWGKIQLFKFNDSCCNVQCRDFFNLKWLFIEFVITNLRQIFLYTRNL